MSRGALGPRAGLRVLTPATVQVQINVGDAMALGGLIVLDPWFQNTLVDSRLKWRRLVLNLDTLVASHIRDLTRSL